MNRYGIGEVADRILAVTIGQNGRITRLQRHRDERGRMIDSEPELSRCQYSDRVDFVARVDHGHKGVIALQPENWSYRYSIGVIPIGSAEPFGDDEFSAGGYAAGGFSGTEEVWFHFEDGVLSWESENASGEVVVNDTFPVLNVVLRLPPGNEGEIEFTTREAADRRESGSRVLTAA